MAVLSAGERRQAVADYVLKHHVESRQTANFDVDQLEAAVAAADDWIDGKIAEMNAALPLAFRNAATPREKAVLFAYVVLRRGRAL